MFFGEEMKKVKNNFGYEFTLESNDWQADERAKQKLIESSVDCLDYLVNKNLKANLKLVFLGYLNGESEEDFFDFSNAYMLDNDYQILEKQYLVLPENNLKVYMIKYQKADDLYETAFFIKLNKNGAVGYFASENYKSDSVDTFLMEAVTSFKYID